jgi:hypothetical protein
METVRVDSVVREAMARGFVNNRALAQWIIATYGLDASVASVLSAFRRLEEKGTTDSYAQARKILKNSYVNTRARRAAIVAPNSPTVHEKLPQVMKSVQYSKGESIRLLSYDDQITIIMDDSNLDKILNILGERNVEKVKRGLVELDVIIPIDAPDIPGTHPLVSNALAVRKINLEETYTGPHHEVIFVKEEDLLPAFDALSGLVSKDPKAEVLARVAVSVDAREDD